MPTNSWWNEEIVSKNPVLRELNIKKNKNIIYKIHTLKKCKLNIKNIKANKRERHKSNKYKKKKEK